MSVTYWVKYYLAPSNDLTSPNAKACPFLCKRIFSFKQRPDHFSHWLQQCVPTSRNRLSWLCVWPVTTFALTASFQELSWLNIFTLPLRKALSALLIKNENLGLTSIDLHFYKRNVWVCVEGSISLIPQMVLTKSVRSLSTSWSMGKNQEPRTQDTTN